MFDWFLNPHNNIPNKERLNPSDALMAGLLIRVLVLVAATVLAIVIVLVLMSPSAPAKHSSNVPVLRGVDV